MTTGIIPDRPGADPGKDCLAGAAIWRFSQMSDAHGDLCTRAGRASGAARHARDAAGWLRARAGQMPGAWRTARSGHPGRRGWLPLMTLAALALLALDSRAAYSAAEALGGGQWVTLLWAALLRSGFFAAAGAAVFTACTVMLVAGGFAATRCAETLAIWRARCRARRATAARRAGERDRRIGACLARMRPAQRGDSHDQQPTPPPAQQDQCFLPPSRHTETSRKKFGAGVNRSAIGLVGLRWGASSCR